MEAAWAQDPAERPSFARIARELGARMDAALEAEALENGLQEEEEGSDDDNHGGDVGGAALPQQEGGEAAVPVASVPAPATSQSSGSGGELTPGASRPEQEREILELVPAN